MQITGRHLRLENNFRLGDVLSLGLHEHIDAWSEIVDCAEKELLVEKVASSDSG